MSLFKINAMRFAAVALVASVGLAACGPLHAPGIPFAGPSAKQKAAAAKSKVKGERIPVLSLNKPLEASPALKGIGFSISPAQDNADWTMGGGNATHAMEHVKGGSGLKIAWRKRIGDGDSFDAHITAQPVVQDGVIYALDGHALLDGFEHVIEGQARDGHGGQRLHLHARGAGGLHPRRDAKA